MNFITAFFMAWGNFITLPCPYKKWDGKLKNLMLALLPSVGAVVAALFILLMWVMQRIDVPPLIMTLVAEFYMFYIHGFMHLDGFMDCTDAVMSRRPLEERQNIMKDSNVGAFAVVMTAFLLLAWFVCFYTAIETEPNAFWAMAMIPIISRDMAGCDVLRYEPIGHSQYVEDHKETGRFKYVLISTVQMLIYYAILIAITWKFGVLGLESGIFSALIWYALGATMIGQTISSMIARKSLGGMSGDIAGYSIVWGELIGVAGTALAVTYM